jgi:uncharacterized protein (TIGR02246 family)
MRHLLPLLALGFTLLISAGSVQAQHDEAGETAIRQLVQNYMNARNTKDAEATRRLFTNDADQLVSTGEWRKGIDGLVRGAMVSSQREAGKSSITVESVRFLQPDVAIVDGRYETYSAGSNAPRKMWTTLVVERQSGTWKIAAIRNMLPVPNVAQPH